MKEIIIDRVNVAGCVRLGIDNIFCDLGGECKGFENCIYKQLKRLEQENNILKQSEDESKEIIAELEAENKKLRSENKKLRQVRKDLPDIQSPYVVLYRQIKAENRKLIQTLADIKEIVERGFKHSQCNCGAKADLDLILQEISECEGNDG